MQTFRVAFFTNRQNAEQIRERLVREGLAAEIHRESPLQKLWFVSRPGTGVRLKVPFEQSEAAGQKLAEWKRRGEVPGVVSCPQCGSFRVAYPQFTKRSFLTNLLMGLGAAVGIVEKDYYCEVCHYTWPKEERNMRDRRAHAAS